MVAVGTTSVRTLEHAAKDRGLVPAGSGDADLFITPGFRFRVVDVFLTNFHLPRSTPLILVAAFAGLEATRRAYLEAIARRYRFLQLRRRDADPLTAPRAVDHETHALHAAHHRLRHRRRRGRIDDRARSGGDPRVHARRNPGHRQDAGAAGPPRRGMPDPPLQHVPPLPPARARDRQGRSAACTASWAGTGRS